MEACPFGTGRQQLRGICIDVSRKQREIASKGGRAAHEKGTAHNGRPTKRETRGGRAGTVAADRERGGNEPSSRLNHWLPTGATYARVVAAPPADIEARHRPQCPGVDVAFPRRDRRRRIRRADRPPGAVERTRARHPPRPSQSPPVPAAPLSGGDSHVVAGRYRVADSLDSEAGSKCRSPARPRALHRSEAAPRTPRG